MLGYQVCPIISGLDSTEYHETEIDNVFSTFRTQSANQVVPDKVIHKMS